MSQTSLSESNEDVGSITFTYPFLEGIDPAAPPATISIPNKYLDAMANMERQYWEIKSKHYNVMIFFKKGKFYELYDYDAVIANREFGLKMVFDTTNRGKMRLAGVPEQSLTEWARLFVFRGYKVGRVEQMKEPENESMGSKLKVVPRELIEVLTPGTLKDPAMLSDHGELFVLALLPVMRSNEVTVDAFAVDLSRRVALRCECSSADAEVTRVCKIESGTGLGLRDTTLRALSALLQQLNPKEIVMPDTDWFSQGDGNGQWFRNAGEEVQKWIAGEGFTVERIPHTHPATKTENATFAERVMASYFTSLCLDGDIALFKEAKPYTAHLASSARRDGGEGMTGSSAATARRESLYDYERRFDRGLTLDAATISNLEVLTNLHDGSEKHSLHECLNRCSTNGGRRLFRTWLLRPSSDARVIAGRQEATRFLADFNLTNALSSVEEKDEQVGEKRSRSGESVGALSAVVTIDFERFLSRLSDMKQNDSQHISYVDPMIQYKKNLGIILSSVHALTSMVAWGKDFLARCHDVASERGRGLPLFLEEHLTSIVAAESSTRVIERLFDRQAAEESGMLIPSPGTSAAYDAAMEKLKHIETQLHDVRRQKQRDVFGGAQVHFSDLGKDLFLLEVAVADAPKVTPPGMVERSRNSRSIKYVVTSLEALVEDHKAATASKAGALLTVLCQVAARICDEFPRLFTASCALSYVDCLLNLARLQHSFPATCYPEIVQRAGEQDEVAAVRGQDLVHPLLVAHNPVPNTVHLDGADGRVLLLTGPNMAGKSTLMRTVAINVLLAQLGGPVLGTRMELAPVDRVFTRIGARDASHKGQSTLYVELSETADILRSATARSLCLVDELGRGTSTHDGMAIAYATLHALTEAKPAAPLTIFSTHYHALAMEQARLGSAASALRHAPSVQLGYMDFVLKTEAPPSAAMGGVPPGNPLHNDEDDNTSRSWAPGAALSSVVFLYRLVRGICARSYGVEVALMAGIPTTLVHLAKTKSDALSRDTAFHEDVRSLAKLTHA